MTCLTLYLFISNAIHAQTAQEINLHNLSAFESPGESWQIVGGVRASLEEPNAVTTTEGSGVLVNDPKNHQGQDLLSRFEHGDIDLELDFMMAKESNSGIYLQGRYELQLLDSWTVKDPASGDNGGIYERWDKSRPEGKKGYQGYAPRQNVSRAPGVWQHLEISFQAPRFNTNGKKVENAKIISAQLNGVTIHEGVQLLGPTRGAMGNAEVAQGPLRFQGDHGAVAFRNISITRFDQQAPSVNDMEYEVFEGTFSEEPNLDTLSAIKSGQSDLLTSSLGSLPDQFLLHYTGTLNNEQAGEYEFGLNVAGGAGLLRIDGEEVISIDNNKQSVDLPEGDLPFELLYIRRAGWGNPNMELFVSGEGLRRQLLSDNRLSGQSRSNPIFVKASDKPLLRSFRDLPGGTRITHAVSVSSMDKVHYTYDLKHGNLVQLWRGNFLNATPMWYNRGDGSSRPEGTVEHLLKKSSLVVNRLDSKQKTWTSDTSGTGFKSRGYTLDRNENPTFEYDIFGTGVEDKIRVVDNGTGVRRTITLEDVADDLYFRIAVGESIKTGANNRYLIDDQSYYIELNNPVDSEPIIRTINGHQELIIPAQSTISYTILF